MHPDPKPQDFILQCIRAEGEEQDFHDGCNGPGLGATAQIPMEPEFRFYRPGYGIITWECNML
jgi:hypothetical protein